MTWLTSHFHTRKPIIAMCHLRALPGDPGYDPAGGLEAVIDAARADLHALQAGGVDAIMFSNEASLPYLTQVEPITTACMARVIAELGPEIDRPYGVNVLWDPKASIDVAVAHRRGLRARDLQRRLRQRLRACGTPTAAMSSDTSTRSAAPISSCSSISCPNRRCIYRIAMWSISPFPPSSWRSLTRSASPGLTAGAETSSETLKLVKDAVPDTPVFANTGVNVGNLEDTLAIADGTVTGTAFKRAGHIWNEVDVERVREFMRIAKSVRGD